MIRASLSREVWFSQEPNHLECEEHEVKIKKASDQALIERYRDEIQRIQWEMIPGIVNGIENVS
jgi:hypothetical protein